MRIEEVGGVTIIQGDAVESLRLLDDKSVNCCVTSPPYFGLRDYGHDGQIGLEPTVAEYVASLVAVFSEVHRVLRDDGVLDRKSTRLNSSHIQKSRMPSSA